MYNILSPISTITMLKFCVEWKHKVTQCTPQDETQTKMQQKQKHKHTFMSLFRQNVVKVMVYFESLDYNTITTHSSYSVSDIIIAGIYIFIDGHVDGRLSNFQS